MLPRLVPAQCRVLAPARDWGCLSPAGGRLRRFQSGAVAGKPAETRWVRACPPECLYVRPFLPGPSVVFTVELETPHVLDGSRPRTLDLQALPPSAPGASVSLSAASPEQGFHVPMRLSVSSSPLGAVSTSENF